MVPERYLIRDVLYLSDCLKLILNDRDYKVRDIGYDCYIIYYNKYKDLALNFYNNLPNNDSLNIKYRIRKHCQLKFPKSNNNNNNILSQSFTRSISYIKEKINSLSFSNEEHQEHQVESDDEFNNNEIKNDDDDVDIFIEESKIIYKDKINREYRKYILIILISFLTFVAYDKCSSLLIFRSNDVNNNNNVDIDSLFNNNIFHDEYKGEFGEKEIKYNNGGEEILDFSGELERIKQRRKEQLLKQHQQQEEEEKEKNEVKNDMNITEEKDNKDNEFSLKREIFKLSIAAVGLILAVIYFSKSKTTSSSYTTPSLPKKTNKTMKKVKRSNSNKVNMSFSTSTIDSNIRDSDMSKINSYSTENDSSSLDGPLLGWINTPVATTRKRRSIVKMNNTSRRHSSRLMELKGRNYQLNNV